MSVIDLAMVVSIILDKSTDALAKKLSRNETVRRISSHLFRNDPPSDDFEAIYVQTLIEYGVFKPEQILNFFKNKFIYQAFQQSFNKNDPSILFREAEDVIQWNEETGKLGKIDYDPRREFAAFTAVFNEIVDRTRPPADVRRDNKLDQLKYQIDNVMKRVDNASALQKTEEILSRLERIENLSTLRLELTRVAPRDMPGIGANRLAAQVRGWFETLNYEFESHERYDLESFEWIISITTRRGYDRILVRGIEGEIGVSDVKQMYQDISKHRVDEGWLIAVRRISPSARAEATNSTDRKVYCYTFDELLDESADFSGYFGWLESEVKRLGIDKMYIPLEAVNFEFDPVTKQKVSQNKYLKSQGGVDRYVDQWLDDLSKEHLSILGEFGTGKTWFSIHYAWLALKRYQDAKSRGVERPRIPLVISLRDYAKAVSVESLFSEFFFRNHEIPIPGYSAFEQLNRMGKLLLIFDGFDEMADRVDKQKMIDNFWELTRVVVPGAKVILTCRTEHFPTAQVGRELLRAELKASTSKLSGETPQFEVLELEKFNKEQIREVLSLKAKPTTVEKIMNFPQLLDLARRPVMTELILEAMPEIEAGKPIDLSRIYLYSVKRKIEQDIKSERTFTSLADKIYFLCEISWEMLSTNKMSINYKQFPSRLQSLFGLILKEQKDIDHWHYDMMGQTMLIRNEDGDYAPAHRSLLEFFVAYKLSAELGLLADDFTEIARSRSIADLDNAAPSADYTWSAYFRRELDKDGTVIRTPRLNRFLTDEPARLAKTFGSEPITKAVLDLMQNMLGTQSENLKHQLLSLARKTAKSSKKYGLIGGNAATILCQLDPLALKGVSLRDTDLRYARFINTDFTNSDFVGANFESAEFNGATLEDADFRHTDLSNCQFVEMGEIYAVAVSPNNNLLASGGVDTNLRVWALETGESVSILKGHEGVIRGIVWGNKSSSIVSIGDDAVIEWDLPNKKNLGGYKNYDGFLIGLSKLPNENQFIGAFSDGSLVLFEFEENQQVAHITSKIELVDSYYGNRVHAGTFGKDNNTIAYYEGVGIFSVIEANSSDKKDEQYMHLALGSMQTNPNRNSIILAGESLILIDTQTYTTIWEKRCKSVHSSVFSLDGNWLFYVEDKQEIGIVEVLSGKKIHSVDAHMQINTLCIDHSNTMLVTGHNDATIRFWDARPFVDKNNRPFLNLSEPLPLKLPSENQSEWPEWWQKTKPNVPNGYLPNPNFGQGLRVIEIKLNCKGMKIKKAVGLDATSANPKLPLADWLVARGAVTS